MRRGRARPKTTETTVSIPVSSLPLGAQAANAFAGWVSPATSIVSLGGANAITASDRTRFVARTAGMSRDQELTMNMYGGCVYLRWTPGGRGIYFSYSPVVNVYELKAMEGVTEGLATGAPFNQGPGATAVLHQFTLPAITSIPGYSTSPSNTWTIGVEGFDIYLKFNGVEFWRTTQFFVLTPGYMGLGVSSTNNGIRTTTATHKISKSLHSDLNTKTYDPRDFGMKSLKTTGTIGANSTTLIVDDATDFAVGDRICIAVGGEAGGGIPGEQGVGGSWPTLKYLTVAAMNSDTTQVTNKCCGVLENGNAYQWNGSSWVSYYGPLDNYLQKILPRALIATITNIAGTTFTLNTPSVAASTNADVYFDSAPLLAKSFGASETSGIRTQSNCTIKFPSGDDWVFGGTDINLTYIPGLNFIGSGKTSTKFRIPKGAPPTSIAIQQCPFGLFGYFGFEDNCRIDSGYMFGFNPTTDVWISASNGLRITSSDRCVATDIRSKNHAVAVVTTNYCADSVIRNIDVVHETAHKRYFQWAVSINDSLNCIIEDITYDCPNLLKGLETFRSNGSILRRARGRNIIWSSNSSSNVVFEDCDFYWEANVGDFNNQSSLPASQRHPSPIEPMINLNSNIDNTSGSQTGSGITIRNCNFDVRGEIFAGYGISLITVSGSVDNVRVEGKYPTKPVSEPSGKFTLPTLGSRPFVDRPVKAVSCDDQTKNVVISGIRINGTYELTPIGAANLSVPAGFTVQNCVVNNLSSGGTQTNNITNAAYEALP